ncbi:hypothetical protein A2U01_0098644, partial [Trifolium medium]|nr:hypothetical protein [Trifolium medium]
MGGNRATLAAATSSQQRMGTDLQ